MAEEGFDNKQETSDPDEDYGLPKIEIKPIQQSESKRGNQKIVNPAVVPTPESSKVEMSSRKNTEPTKEKRDIKTVEEKESGGYAWWVVLLALGGILVAGWFYYNQSSNSKDDVDKSKPIVEEKQPEPVVAPVREQPTEMEEEEVEIFSLTEIKSRAEKPRYFLVVASFIDEDLAKDHTEKLHAQKMNTFLVYPYGDIAYYRLAIGQFESFALAAEEINKVKDNFDENLWVLKY